MLYYAVIDRGRVREMPWGRSPNKQAIRALTFGAVLLGATFAWVEPSSAAPMLSVDMDPSMAGVQSTRTVVQGAMFDIEIFIENVGTTAPDGPLNGFQLTVGGSDALITADSASLGSFLLSPNITVGPILSGGSATIGGATLLPLGASGSGVLATASFTANAVGTTTLALSDVSLSAPFGVPIAVGDLVDGQLTIESDPSLLSAPPALSFLLFGALATVIATRRRRTP